MMTVVFKNQLEESLETLRTELEFSSPAVPKTGPPERPQIRLENLPKKEKIASHFYP